jgi:hypothetical protein
VLYFPGISLLDVVLGGHGAHRRLGQLAGAVPQLDLLRRVEFLDHGLTLGFD